MDRVQWGMIGCGEVAEVKSGPAFNIATDSYLRTVMCRSDEKAADYASRHGIIHYTWNSDELINDRNINAVYIATPPSSHEQYALAAIESGKHVYIEKPMTLDFSSAQRIVKAASHKKVKLSVAHYRREQPLFKKIKELLENNVLDQLLKVKIIHHRLPLTLQQRSKKGVSWRLDPLVSGGGLFHDIAPHQLDLLRYFFGEPLSISGVATNKSGAYISPDHITAQIEFESGVNFSGEWDFNSTVRKDEMEISGKRGKIIFGVFQHELFKICCDGREEVFTFNPILHAQLPMIQQVVNFFLGKSYNPCSGEDGAAVMSMIDEICKPD